MNNSAEKYHILIVDDDRRILKLLQKFFIDNNFLVSVAADTNEALAHIEEFIFDLIILDVMLPEKTGIEFAQELKAKGVVNMPIVMLTALSSIDDKIKGLESGANDYITKPFEPRELLLRVTNLINTHKEYKKEQDLVRFGNNEYNLITKELTQNEKRIKISNVEEMLLDIFLNNTNMVFSREDLAKKMGNNESDKLLNDRSIDVQVARLRNKIETDPKNPQFLRTVRNQGYVFYI